jgi:hypothetical protein
MRAGLLSFSRVAEFGETVRFKSGRLGNRRAFLIGALVSENYFPIALLSCTLAALFSWLISL